MSAPVCIFCEIAAGRAPGYVVWTDNDAAVFLDRSPIPPGHLLIIPREHVGTLWDLEEERFLRLMSLARSLAAPLTEATGADRAGMAVEGYGIPHAHIHLVPINGGGELDPCRQSPASEEELSTAARGVRAAIERHFDGGSKT